MASTEYCIPNCKKGRSKDDEDMVRCCMCAKWFHEECVNLTQDEADGVWPCMTCRLIPSKVEHLQTSMNELLEVTKTKLLKISDQSPVLNSIESMKHEITDIAKTLHTVKQCTHAEKMGRESPK